MPRTVRRVARTVLHPGRGATRELRRSGFADQNAFGLASMKVPRWLMLLMLTSTVVSVLTASGWWWFMWPERTAREYADLVVNGQFHEWREVWAPMPSPADAWKFHFSSFHYFQRDQRAPNGGAYGAIQLKRRPR